VAPVYYMTMRHTSSFSGAAVLLAGHVGVTGIAAGVFLNGLGVPGLGEVLLPLGGLAVRQGQMSLWWLLPVALVAQMAGAVAAYFIARYGGLALVERYGKYVLISHHDLKAAHRASQRYGGRLVVVAAFVPGAQGFIGYAAGLAEMNLGRFVAAATVGKLIWISGLIWLGMVLGGHLALIDSSIKQIGVIVLLGLVALIVWHVLRHRRSIAIVHPVMHRKEN
jgi:membrane protein DedA with SNARE-associated domain